MSPQLCTNASADGIPCINYYLSAEFPSAYYKSHPFKKFFVGPVKCPGQCPTSAPSPASLSKGENSKMATGRPQGFRGHWCWGLREASTLLCRLEAGCGGCLGVKAESDRQGHPASASPSAMRPPAEVPCWSSSCKSVLPLLWPGSVPGQEREIPQAAQHGNNNNKTYHI